MLESIVVTNEQGSSLTLPLQSYSEGYLIRNIEGLDPVKASLSSTNVAQMDGALFQHARRDPRNIVLTVGLITDYVTNNIRELRSELYRHLMPKGRVTLQFVFDDMETVTIDGVVESTETQQFAIDSEVSISVMCYSPDFVGITEKTASGSTVTTSSGTPLLIPYEGSTPTGIKFTMTMPRALSGFIIYVNNSYGGSSAFSVDLQLASGSKLDISTLVGQKSLILNNADSVLYGVPADAVWPLLTPGDNVIKVVTAGAAIPYTIKYRSLFGGL